MGEPFQKDGLEGVLAIELGGEPLLLAVDVGIDFPSQQGTCFIPQGAGVSQGDLWVAPQRHPPLPAEPLIAEMPGFAPARGNGQ